MLPLPFVLLVLLPLLCSLPLRSILMSMAISTLVSSVPEKEQAEEGLDARVVLFSLSSG